MNILNTIILGLIQGITEFLPVSSSGHLAIFENILNYKISLPEELILDIGTLIALLFFTRFEIVQIIKEVLNPKILTSENSFTFGKFQFSKKATLVILGSIPVILAGVILKPILETKTQSLALVAIMMIIVGIYMIVAEKIGSKSKVDKNLSIKNILVIGISQIFALIRGTSRSGVTISTGIFLGFKREEAVKMSFLIGIPALLGSSLLGVFDIAKSGIDGTLVIPLLAGFLASLISGVISIKILMNFVKNHSLTVFSIYRIIAGVILLIFSITR
ncbi:MAG: undecaprenyl-diphosphate phosphatase [bacterium]